MDHPTSPGMCNRRSRNKERGEGKSWLRNNSLSRRFLSHTQNRCSPLPPPRITWGWESQPSQTGSARSDGAAPWPSSEPLTTYSASASLMWHVRHSGTPATTPEKKRGERGKGRRRVHLYLNILEGGRTKKTRVKKKKGNTLVGEAWSRRARSVEFPVFDDKSDDERDQD